MDYATKKQSISVEVNEDARDAFQELKDCEKLDIQIKKHREKRSLDANRVFYIFLDPSAKGLAEEVRRATRAVSLDYQVLLRDAENDVALGISRVQKVLCFDIMSVAPKQEYAVSEFGTYEYDKKSIEKGKEVPVKEDDHCMDAIRYCVMGAWKRLKYWLPKDETEEIDVCDISRKEVEDDEYL